MALPITYMLAVVFGLFIFACVVGSIMAMLYFLYYHLRKVKNNIPDQYKGGEYNAESKSKEGRGGSGGIDTNPRKRRRWFGRRKRDPEDSTDENHDGFEHRVQVQPTLPFPEVERKPDSTNKNSKRDWPSFS